MRSKLTYTKVIIIQYKNVLTKIPITLPPKKNPITPLSTKKKLIYTKVNIIIQ